MSQNIAMHAISAAIAWCVTRIFDLSDWYFLAIWASMYVAFVGFLAAMVVRWTLQDMKDYRKIRLQ